VCQILWCYSPIMGYCLPIILPLNRVLSQFSSNYFIIILYNFNLRCPFEFLLPKNGHASNFVHNVTLTGGKCKPQNCSSCNILRFWLKFQHFVSNSPLLRSKKQTSLALQTNIIPWNRYLLEKLTLARVINKLSASNAIHIRRNSSLAD
jgi:hypothetical protein